MGFRGGGDIPAPPRMNPCKVATHVTLKIISKIVLFELCTLFFYLDIIGHEEEPLLTRLFDQVTRRNEISTKILHYEMD